MVRIKERPVTQILNLIEALSTDEKRIIYDHVRPAPKPHSKPKPERKPSQKRKAGKDTTVNHSALDGRSCAWKGCGRFLDDNVHQLETWTDYHEFVELAGEASKGVGA